MMNHLKLVLLVAAVITSQTEARKRRSVGTLTLKASPRVSVEGVTDEIRIDCRPAPTVTDVQFAILKNLEKIDENGTTSVVASSRINALEVAEQNRTLVERYLQTDIKDKASFLTVVIKNPVVADGGIYQCRYIYLNTTWHAVALGSKINVTVTEVPLTNYPTTAECDCDNIWSEIENLKAALAVRNEAPGSPAQQYDDKCRTSFSARFETRHGYQIVADKTAIFDHVISNKGNAYNSTTGIFTAACDGQYFITATLRAFQNQDSGYVDGVIEVDNKPWARTSIFVDAAIDNYQSATNGVVLTLKQGQEVKVVIKTTSSGEFVGEEYSIFSGFFLFP